MKPKILYIDIETSPLLSYCWGLFDQNISLNQMVEDAMILSFAAKWDHEDKVIYMDQRNEKKIEDDRKLLKGIWKLLDEADIVVGQNHRRFDIKRLNARFIQQGMTPPSSYKTIDTLSLAKKHFGFTSNKLEYLSDKLCKKYKKLKHKKYPGFELWSECLKGNKDAWKEMELYNKHDVLALEELHYVLQPWDNSINYNLYTDEAIRTCNCGSSKLIKKGFSYTVSAKYQRYVCLSCGAQSKDSKNLFSKTKRESLLRPNK